MRKPYLLHIDMDCFYAAVEMRDNPELKNKPVIVGALPGTRGVISACNYEARRYGLHSAMPISRASRLCPKGVFLPCDMEKYCEESEKVMDILRLYTDSIEQISVDEAFMEVSDLGKLFGTPETIAKSIKGKIRSELSLTASVGGAPVRFVAKIASDLRKPDGLLILDSGDVEKILEPLPISKLPGLGSKGCESLYRLGIRTVGSLRKYSHSGLRSALGINIADELKELSHGIGNSEITTERDVKSISREYTFQNDTNDTESLRRTLLYLTDDVARKLRQQNLEAKTIQLTWRTVDFERHSRQKTICSPTDCTETIFKETESLFKLGIAKGTFVRLIGMGVSNFKNEGKTEQLSFFSVDSGNNAKSRRVDAAKDAITQKHGECILTRAALLENIE